MPEIAKTTAEPPALNVKCLVDVHHIPHRAPMGTRPVTHPKGTILEAGVLHDRDVKHLLANKHIEITKEKPAKAVEPGPAPASDAAPG